MATQVKRSDNTALVLIDKFENFSESIEQDLKLADKYGRVTALTIIGLQSSGKSTLMNKCFHTRFPEMDAKAGPSKTTEGVLIGIGQTPQNAGYTTLVIDTEGFDGAERGQMGNDSYEKKTMLFALSVSNTVIFNMKCDSVNLYGGSSSPLMESVFEARVRIREFGTPRQINLLFVLRDRNECPLDKLTQKLREQLHKIWNRLPKSSNPENAKLENYFKIQVVLMPHYKHEKNEFSSEVISLRERINSLVPPSRQLDTASGFFALAKTNWDVIKADKILNVSHNRIEVAELLCYKSLNKNIETFKKDQRWIQIKNDVESGEVVEGFGNKVSTVIGGNISQYDEETVSLDENHRLNHRDYLTRQILKEVEHCYLSLVKMARDTAVSDYQKKIVEKIRKGPRAFKKSEPHYTYISQYQTFMKDIFIKQGNWVDGDDKLLEEISSELDSIEKGGLYLATELRKIQFMKFDLKAMKIVGITYAFILLPAVITLIKYIRRKKEYEEAKRVLEETCRLNPIIGALHRQLEEGS